MSDSSPVAVVSARSFDGPLVVSATAPTTPHNIAAVLWRYDASKQPIGFAGEFTRTVPSVPIGAPSSVRDNFFLIEGAVIANGDNPPVPYQVVVTISQPGRLVHRAVPTDGGAGAIGKEDARFSFRFQITEAAP
jgi:hypothetical protein